MKARVLAWVLSVAIAVTAVPSVPVIAASIRGQEETAEEAEETGEKSAPEQTELISETTGTGSGEDVTEITEGSVSDNVLQSYPVAADAGSVATVKGVYLSDLEWESESKAGWGSLQKDKNINGETITLKLDGVQIAYEKGLGAHATSTIIYNIEAYAVEYPRFITKIGVDASQGTKGAVQFTISVSNNKQEWTALYTSPVLTAASNAEEIDLKVNGWKYLKLYADKGDGDGNDHAVYADARLIQENYDPSMEDSAGLFTVKKYDEILSAQTADYNYEKNFETVMCREFVNRSGFANIQNLVKNTEGMEETLEWILQPENLQLFLEAGTTLYPDKTLTALNQLYQKYKTILDDTEDGKIYKKMLIATAVAYGGNHLANSIDFYAYYANFDVIARFNIMKQLYDTETISTENPEKGNKTETGFVRKDEFKTYNMELIRAVMGDAIDADEVFWLRNYAQYRYPNDSLDVRFGPYSYMDYIHGPDYRQAGFYAEENKGQYTAKYFFDKFGIQYGVAGDVKLWMVLEAGGICWNMSRMGQTLCRTHGIPSYGIFQPGHEAFLIYSENEKGEGIWSIGNNVGGWGPAYSSWGGNPYFRLPFGWGSESAYGHPSKDNPDSGYVCTSAGYILLAQDAMNHYEEYQKSFYYNLIANSYSDAETKEKTYQQALTSLNNNLDSYIGLIQSYENRNAEEAEWLALGEKILDTYTYFPGVMSDLLEPVSAHLTGQNLGIIDIKRTSALKKAEAATAAESLQYDACKQIATKLLGKDDEEFATFSFDGENGGQVVFASSLENFECYIQYSLDGGDTWIDKGFLADDVKKFAFSEKELASITAENDLKLRYTALPDEIFTIDILAGESVNNKVFGNDNEDSFTGNTENLEYSPDDGSTWKDYAGELFTGAQTVTYRYKAHGTYLAGASASFTFTESKDTPECTYIPIKNVSFVYAYSYQEGQPPENMLDANPITTWHTKHGEFAGDRDYIVAFDKVRYLSAVEYLPGDGSNGRIKTVEVYASLDNENWTKISGTATWADNNELKSIDMIDKVPAKYIKIVAVNTYTNGNEAADKYVSGKDFYFYEDTTLTYVGATISYSTNTLTNQDVVATLDYSPVITVIGESTYTFTENGEFTFRYKEGEDGEIQEATAKVTWIDKVVPTAEIEYETIDYKVIARVVNPSEEIIFTSGDNGVHEFLANGEYVFTFCDRAGNINTLKAEVTSIQEGGNTDDGNQGGDNPKPPGPETDNGDVLPEDVPQDGIPEGIWVAGLDREVYYYSGTAIKPEIRVYDYKTLLKEKTDYTVSYKNTTNAFVQAEVDKLGEDSGEYKKAMKKAPTITVTGKGNYTDKVITTFDIRQRDIKGEEITAADIFVNVNDKNEKLQKPQPVVKDGTKKLKNKKDYTIAYYKTAGKDAVEGFNINEAGEYTIIITGTGNYTGERIVKYQVKEGTLASRLKVTKIPAQSYTGAVIEPEIEVFDGTEPLTEHVHYELDYADNVKPGTATVKIIGLEGQKEGDKDYFGEKTVTFKITGRAISRAKVEFPEDTEFIYPGDDVELVEGTDYNIYFSYTNDEGESVNDPLNEGQDYEVSYKNNHKAGTATIIFQGINGYTGTLKKTFKIKPYNILEDEDRVTDISCGASYSYIKGGCKPEPVITVDGKELTPKTDYTITHKNNKQLFDMTELDEDSEDYAKKLKKAPAIIIKGKGNYTGSVTIYYSIVPSSLCELKAVAADKVYKSKANNYKTTVKVYDVDGKALSAGRDYDSNVEYRYVNDTILENTDEKGNPLSRGNGALVESTDIIPAGTEIKAVIKPLESGSYSGSEEELTAYYRIIQSDIKKVKLDGKIADQYYTGKAIELTGSDIKIYDGKIPNTNEKNYLTLGEDYVIKDAYKNNVKKGKASVTIVGIGNYGGEKTLTFTIKSRGFFDFWKGWFK